MTARVCHIGHMTIRPDSPGYCRPAPAPCWPGLASSWIPLASNRTPLALNWLQLARNRGGRGHDSPAGSGTCAACGPDSSDDHRRGRSIGRFRGLHGSPADARGGRNRPYSKGFRPVRLAGQGLEGAISKLSCRNRPMTGRVRSDDDAQAMRVTTMRPTDVWRSGYRRAADQG